MLDASVPPADMRGSMEIRQCDFTLIASHAVLSNKHASRTPAVGGDGYSTTAKSKDTAGGATGIFTAHAQRLAHWLRLCVWVRAHTRPCASDREHTISHRSQQRPPRSGCDFYYSIFDDFPLTRHGMHGMQNYDCANCKDSFDRGRNYSSHGLRSECTQQGQIADLMCQRMRRQIPQHTLKKYLRFTFEILWRSRAHISMAGDSKNKMAAQCIIQPPPNPPAPPPANSRRLDTESSTPPSFGCVHAFANADMSLSIDKSSAVTAADSVLTLFDFEPSAHSILPPPAPHTNHAIVKSFTISLVSIWF